jgi:regulatory protein
MTTADKSRMDAERRRSTLSDTFESKSSIRDYRRKQVASTSSPDVPVLRRAAMDYLARREHSAFELRQKLSCKYPEADPQEMDTVLERLREGKLQSDTRFTTAFIRYRKSRGFGYLHLKADLGSRGIAASLIDEYLWGDDDWLAIAEALVGKKLGDNEKIGFGSKQHRKILRFLESRGFSATETRQVLRKKLLHSC